MALDAWVIDGSYRGKLGDLVLDHADTVVWLDLPRRVWLTRLVVRTLRRIDHARGLWNGNRESLAERAWVDSDSLFAVRASRTSARAVIATRPSSRGSASRGSGLSPRSTRFCARRGGASGALRSRRPLGARARSA